MDGAPHYPPPRKKLRVGVVSERGAINAVKALLERNKLVVQEYDTRNDYGKDLVIDLTENGEITGAMVAAQVKGGLSFIRGKRAFIPARVSDIMLWADSTVPVSGIVWNPETEELFWTNLTEHCRAIRRGNDWWPAAQDAVREIRVERPLNDESLPLFVELMRVAAASTSSDAFLALADNDDDRRQDGVFTCWTFGRGDARALILLRRMLPHLEGRSFLDGVSVLTTIAGNPDVFYHQGNWIPDNIQNEAERQFDWNAAEIEAMFHQHELLDDEGQGWQRGGSGQALWHVLNPLGFGFQPPFVDALAIAVAKRRFDTAFRLLVAVQWAADDPAVAIRTALEAHPELAGHEYVNMLLAHVDQWGRADIY